MKPPSGMIDSHHHLWRFSEDEYDWIDRSMGALRRDFAIDDLSRTIAPTGVTRTIAIQARQTVAETEWLLDTAEGAGPVTGVVGWLPLSSPDVGALLEQFSSRPTLVGLRHIIQDEPDDDFILGSDFNAGVSRLRDFELAYDVLIKEHQLPKTVEFVTQHPDQRFVLDHIGKPRIVDGWFDRWASGIKEIARREHVYCKLSGMVTEADWTGWTVEQFQRYIDLVLEAFGPERTMFGSDWPVCLLATGYEQWVSAVSAMTDWLSDDERERLFRDTAVEAYQLEGQ